MNVEIKTTKVYDVKYIGFDIPVRDGDIEYNGTDENLFNGIKLNNNHLALKIDVETGKVCDWEYQGLTSDFVIYSKVVDEGVYTIYDDKFKVITEIEDYVPDILSCIDDGYGDYLSMVISPDGQVDMWCPNKLHKFIDTINDECN